MKRSIRKNIIKAIKEASKYNRDKGLSAIKAVKQGDFIIEGNDIIVGSKTFDVPWRYYNLPI